VGGPRRVCRDWNRPGTGTGYCPHFRARPDHFSAPQLAKSRRNLP
jgi:hypothetical protein